MGGLEICDAPLVRGVGKVLVKSQQTDRYLWIILREVDTTAEKFRIFVERNMPITWLSKRKLMMMLL